MRFLFYTHSLISDWNHGNAHFLRGILRELMSRDHAALALEPRGGWSRVNLLAEKGEGAIRRFARDFPELQSLTYDAGFDHEAQLSSADVVIVHEWTDPALIARIGMARRRPGRFTLLFHDTHHRAVSKTSAIAALSLEDYDAVLAFGETLRARYLHAGWGRRVHTWHEAADVRLFQPHPAIDKDIDLVWIGNWGDGERSAELSDYLIEPVRQLAVSATVHGVRYPASALAGLADAGLAYQGWVPNAQVPRIFARHRATVHIPRRPYVESLPGIPTIRMFEALACGIPLLSAPWDDAENLFRPGVDFLLASSGARMAALLREVVRDADLARSLSAEGLKTIHARHTCGHRVDELLRILRQVGSARVVDQLALETGAA